MITPLAIGTAVRQAREAAGLSIAALAERSGISRAMITKIEREQAQPTAVLLGRLSGGLGISLSALVARAEGDGFPVSRAVDQPVWIDPATGYRRRALSPQRSGPLELVEIDLPGGAVVAYPPEAALHAHQQIWVLQGELRVHENELEHVLAPGDCLSLTPGTARECATTRGCRYLVAMVR